MALPLRQRITAAVRRRLEMNAGHVDSWPQVSPSLAYCKLGPLQPTTSLYCTALYCTVRHHPEPAMPACNQHLVWTEHVTGRVYTRHILPDASWCTAMVHMSLWRPCMLCGFVGQLLPL
jgi:hypothetical protein